TGIAKGTIYRFFPNKGELFAAPHMQFIETITREVSRFAGGSDPVENIRAMLVCAGTLIEEQSDFFQVMLRHECEVWELKSSEVLQQRNVLRDLYVAQIEAAEAMGMIKCRYGARMAADMLMGMMRNILRFTLPAPEPAVMAEMMM